MAVLSTVLAACSINPFQDPVDWAHELAARHDFTPLRIPAGDYSLLAFHRNDATAGALLTVYIEGDGRRWPASSRPPADPTPRRSLTLRLAVQHAAGEVLYLARPCQYLPRGANRACSPAYWTDRRYAPEVVAAMGRAIDQVKDGRNARPIRLIGYSGGGAIAALLAARRRDVMELVTIAAVLDTEAWTRREGLSPLSGSLNPLDEARKLTRLPQVHFYGAGDAVVPAYVQASFVDSLGAGHMARLVRVDRADHTCCWARLWPGLLAKLDAGPADPDRRPDP